MNQSVVKFVYLVILVTLNTACLDVPETLRFPVRGLDAEIGEDADAESRSSSDASIPAKDSSQFDATPYRSGDMSTGFNDGGVASQAPILRWVFGDDSMDAMSPVSRGLWSGYALDLSPSSAMLSERGLELAPPVSMAALMGSSERLTRQIISRQEFSVILRFSADSTEQPGPELRGPARIFTWSLNTSYRNLTIGQLGDEVSVRLRLDRPGDPYQRGFIPSEQSGVDPHPVIITDTDALAGDPESDGGFRWVHLILRLHRTEGLSLWIDGLKHQPTPSDATDVTAGIANWDPSFGLAFGDEFNRAGEPATELTNDSRPWFGVIREFALYDRALTDDEIMASLADVSPGGVP